MSRMTPNENFAEEKSTPDSSKYKTLPPNPTFYDKSHECASTSLAGTYLGGIYIL